MKQVFRRLSTATYGAAVVVLLAAGPAAADPNPKPGLPKDLETKLDSLLGLLMSLVIVACVAGILIVAGKMALAHRRGEGGEAVGQLGYVLGACVLVGSASTIVLWAVA